jgi:hypothetical protein
MKVTEDIRGSQTFASEIVPLLASEHHLLSYGMVQNIRAVQAKEVRG